MSIADVRFETAGPAVVAHLLGEIDLSNAAPIGRAIHDEIPNQALVLVLDMSEVDYLDSAGIQLMYQLREDLRIRGQQLRLVVPPDSPAADTLRLTGLDSYLQRYETVEAALSEAPANAATRADPE
jgi:anti-anti-sigma factor